MQTKFLVIGFVLVGCGGPASGGGTHFSTSVSGSAPLAGLSPSQQAQLCSDGEHFSSSLAVDVCKTVAFLNAEELALSNTAATDSGLQAACTSAYNDCVTANASASSSAGSGISTCEANVSALDPSTCTATVAQFSACLNDLGAAEDQLASKVPSCSSVTTQSLASSVSQDAGITSEPSSCATLASVCPAAITTTTTMM